MIEKILYGIVLSRCTKAKVHGRMLVVGEKINHLFAVSKCYEGKSRRWSLTHLPTGYAAGTAWKHKKLAVKAAHLLEQSGFLDTTSIDEIDFEDNQEFKKTVEQYRRLYFELDDEVQS